MSLVDEARAVRERIAARLQELEPLVREYEQLQRLAAEMGVEGSDSAPSSIESGAERAAAQPRPAARRRLTASRRGATARRAPQRSGEAQLVERVLEAVRADPGRTVAEYAAALGVAPTGLYRPVRRLTNDGELVKRARQLFPA